MAVVKNDAASPGLTVGHVPRKLSRRCWYFLHNDGETTCEILGSRRLPLVQGGLEIPCIYKFVGKKKHKKATQIIEMLVTVVADCTVS